MKLTHVTIAALAPGDYPDAAYPGLSIRVGVRRRTWTLRHRVVGKLRRTKLGFFPKMGIVDARKAADSISERVDTGAPVEPLIEALKPTATTVGDLIDIYERTKRKENYRIKTLHEAMRTVRRGLEPWLGLPLRSFTKTDLRAARDVMNEGNTHMGNRFLGYVSPVLRFAAQEDMIDHNFAMDIRRAPEKSRQRTLTEDELRRVWIACDSLGDTVTAAAFVRLLRFLILTGQRYDECASLRHGDLLGGIWRLKAEDTKAGREHRLRLPALALAIVGKGSDPRALVFANQAGAKIQNEHIWKRRLDEASGVTGWRLHDLRRTFSTGLQHLKIEPYVIEACLNHTLKGVMKTYLTADLVEQKAEALAAWAAELERIVGKQRAVS